MTDATLTQGGGTQSAPLPIPYAADEVSRTFQDLLQTFDFRYEMQELGIGLFGRGKAKKEFTALCIGLWGLALERSFPNDAADFFAHFVSSSPLTAGDKKGPSRMRDLVQGYVALLSVKKETDFSAAADHMVGVLKLGGEGGRSRQLKLALMVRTLYNEIFKQMI